MLTLLHLSDIHFSKKDDASQFDLNRQIRDALLTDVTSNFCGHPYDGLIVSGDIAASGKKEEYDAAKKWLSEVYSRTGLSMKVTYTIPGNHDVDRSHVGPTFPLWASHADIRRNNNPSHWHGAIETQIKKDPAQLLLNPLRTYNDFAQGCECQTTKDDLAWCHDFPKSLPLGHSLRLRGLNSALISDAEDAPGNLLVSQFQTSTFENTPGKINLTICHHPPDWLMDKQTVRIALRAFSQINLFGHEHSARVETGPTSINLFAGAMCPPRSEPLGWLPTYHVLLIDIEGEAKQPILKVKVFTRELHNYHFDRGRGEGHSDITEFSLNLPPFMFDEIGPDDLQSTDLPQASESTVEQYMKPTTASEDHHRDLVVNFFSLPTPKRYKVVSDVGLIRDGDDSLDPQTMWAEIFKRSEVELKMADLWDAIASNSTPMIQEKNPFRS
jgi:calcineurin-like phosphoesterase family protein